MIRPRRAAYPALVDTGADHVEAISSRMSPSFQAKLELLRAGMKAQAVGVTYVAGADVPDTVACNACR